MLSNAESNDRMGLLPTLATNQAQPQIEQSVSGRQRGGGAVVESDGWCWLARAVNESVMEMCCHQSKSSRTMKYMFGSSYESQQTCSGYGYGEERSEAVSVGVRCRSV